MNNACRICLSQNSQGTFISIFNEHENVFIHQKIMSITSVTIHKDDNLPQSICSGCLDRLHKGYSFKLDCEKSDVLLREQINKKLDTKTDPHIDVRDDKLENNVNENMEGIEDTGDCSLNKSNSPEKITTKRAKNHKRCQCFTCGKILSTRFRLKTHMSIHAGEKPFKCFHCNKTFTHSHSLKIHERIHTGEKPFTCDICNKQFAQSSGFIVHKRLHTGEKPFSCKFCNSEFRTKSHLEYHIRNHTGEKKYKCESCNKAFITGNALKQHEKSHSGEKPFICYVCGLSLTRATHLKRHMKVHDRSETVSKIQKDSADSHVYGIKCKDNT